jgi:predicted RNase H-like nuclease (RuvC/YqgF family)
MGDDDIQFGELVTDLLGRTGETVEKLSTNWNELIEEWQMRFLREKEEHEDTSALLRSTQTFLTTLREENIRLYAENRDLKGKIEQLEHDISFLRKGRITHTEILDDQQKID